MFTLDPLEVLHFPERALEHALIEEHQSVERLGLRRSCNPPLRCEVVQELLHLGRTHFARVSLVMKQDEVPNPVAIALLRARAEMSPSASKGNLLKQSRAGVREGASRP